MRVASSLLVDLSLDRPSVIDQLRQELAITRVMEGRVIEERFPGRYLVEIGGRRLTFMPTRALEPGGTFLARLSGAQLVFDFAESASAISASNRGTATPTGVTVQSVPQLLMQLGLPTEPSYIASVQSLIQAGVSLTREAIQLFEQIVGVRTADDALLLSFLIQRGIPVDASLMATLEKISKERKKLGVALSELITTLERLKSGREGREALGSKLRQWLDRFRQLLPQFDLEASSHSLEDRVREGIHQSGLFRESSWAFALSKEPPGVLRLDDLKSLLLELDSQLLDSQLGRLNEERPEFQTEFKYIMELTEAALNRIQETQLASLRAPWEQRQVWMLELPFWMGNQFESIRMTIEGEAPDGSRPMSFPIRVDLYLELSELGSLKINLTLTSTGVDGQIYSDRPEVVRLLESAVGEWIREKTIQPGEENFIRTFRVRQVSRPTDLEPPLFLQPRWSQSGEDRLERVDVEA